MDRTLVNRPLERPIAEPVETSKSQKKPTLVATKDINETGSVDEENAKKLKRHIDALAAYKEFAASGKGTFSKWLKRSNLGLLSNEKKTGIMWSKNLV